MNAKPTLHDIAAMPFPASLRAMREHYDKYWGFGEGPPTTWKVQLEYSFTQTDIDTFEVEASNEDTAIEMAKELLRDEHSGIDDIEVVSAEEVEPQQ